MPMGLGLGLNLATLGQGVGYSDEALALFDRFATPPSPARKLLINDLILALKTAGVWSKLDALYVTAAADSQAARRNWIADAYNLTAVSSPTFTADQGYTGDGAAAYLKTGFNPVAAGGHFAQNSAFASATILTDIANNTIVLGAHTSGSANIIRVNPRSSTDTMVGALNSGSVAQSANTNGSGTFAVSRTGSAAGKIYRGGSALASFSTATDAMPNLEIYLLANNSNGSASSFSARQIAAAAIGGGMTDAEEAAYDAAIATYLTALGVSL